MHLYVIILILAFFQDTLRFKRFSLKQVDDVLWNCSSAYLNMFKEGAVKLWVVLMFNLIPQLFSTSFFFLVILPCSK